MKASLVAAVAALLASHAAHAEDTFEARARGAEKLHRVEGLVWALTAACDAGDDVEQRQCKHVREARAKELQTGTWLVDADVDAFDIGPWNAQKKSVSVSLDACIRCTGVEVDGKTWYVTGNAPNGRPHFEGGRLRPGALYDKAQAFGEEAPAAMWARATAKVRVEMVVKLAAKPRWSDGGKNGLALDVLGFRVITPCDGAIVIAQPASSPVEADKKACPAPADVAARAEADAGPRAEQLTASMIDEAMQPVVDAAWKCYEHFAVTGKAKLKITVTADGGILKYEQQGDFSNTPTGACIDKALTKAKFQRNKKVKTTVLFPITLQP
ncbi:MAG: hypothetical protein ABI678_01710 [Kofleriaceae bacterium]